MNIHIATNGSDSNPGTEAAPVRSLAAGYALLRDKQGDSLLLRGGDAWDEPLPFWGKSNATVGTYGTGRATVRSFESIAPVGAVRENLTLRNLRFADYSGTAVSILNGWRNVTLDNLLIERCGSGVCFAQCDPGQRASSITVRNCVVVDSYTTGTNHPQGMIFGEVDGLTIEGCVVDHNGWLESVPGAVPTIFRHNLYIQHDCTGVMVRNNIVARAGSTGISQRCGGVCRDNLCIQNPIPIGFGHASGGPVVGDVFRNIVIDSRDIDAANPRAYGIVVSGASGVVVTDNIVAHLRSGTANGFGFAFDFGYGDVSIGDNVHLDWKQPNGRAWPSLKFDGVEIGPVTQDGNDFRPQDTTPDISIGAYLRSIGRTGGIPEFMAAARTQDALCTAAAFSAWARSQFNNPADIDGDGTMTVNDAVAFMNLAAAGDPRADLNRDGEINILDYIAMQNALRGN